MYLELDESYVSPYAKLFPILNHTLVKRRKTLKSFVTFLVGFDPLTILRAATFSSARALVKEHELGIIKRGFYADFVVYEKNLLKDITVLHYPKSVFKAGKRVADAGGIIWSISLIERGR